MTNLTATWHLMTRALPFVSWSAADLVLRGSLLLLATIGVRALLRGRSAAVRHFVGLLGTAALLLLPITMSILPAGMGLLPSLTAPPPVAADATPTAGLTAVGWLAMVWAAGAALVLLRLLVGRSFLGRVFERAASVPANGAALQAAARAHGLAATVAVRTSAEVDVPLAFGFLRPRVLLPADSGQWSQERLELVLLHETAHLRRLDQVTQTLSLVVTALYWFHPLVWLGSRHLALDREHACDDLVLHARGNATRYARQLVAIAEALAGKRPPALAVTMARPSQLRQRLTALLDSSRDRRTLRPRDAVLGFAFTALAFASVGARGTSAEAAAIEERERGATHDGSVEERRQEEAEGVEEPDHRGTGHPSGLHPETEEPEPFEPAFDTETMPLRGHGGTREETWQ